MVYKKATRVLFKVLIDMWHNILFYLPCCLEFVLVYIFCRWLAYKEKSETERARVCAKQGYGTQPRPA